MPKAPDNTREFAALLKVVEALRGPDGCPWDKEQTHRTLTRFAIEEAAEFAEAVDTGSDAEIREELGDLLLQVVLNAEIARQESRFDIHDVIQTLNDKMIRRHPHVFADAVANTSGEVLDRWAKIKAAEKADKSSSPKPLSFDIPVALPALLRAQKIGEKTVRQHFDWARPEDVLDKVREEMRELEDAFPDRDRIEAELGDVLFSLAQLARHLRLDAEQALRLANARFEKRYFTMREMAAAEGRDWDQLTPAERESYWAKAKAALARELLTPTEN